VLQALRVFAHRSETKIQYSLTLLQGVSDTCAMSTCAVSAQRCVRTKQFSKVDLGAKYRNSGAKNENVPEAWKVYLLSASI